MALMQCSRSLLTGDVWLEGHGGRATRQTVASRSASGPIRTREDAPGAVALMCRQLPSCGVRPGATTGETRHIRRPRLAGGSVTYRIRGRKRFAGTEALPGSWTSSLARHAQVTRWAAAHDAEPCSWPANASWTARDSPALRHVTLICTDHPHSSRARRLYRRPPALAQCPRPAQAQHCLRISVPDLDRSRRRLPDEALLGCLAAAVGTSVNDIQSHHDVHIIAKFDRGVVANASGVVDFTTYEANQATGPGRIIESGVPSWQNRGSNTY